MIAQRQYVTIGKWARFLDAVISRYVTKPRKTTVLGPLLTVPTQVKNTRKQTKLRRQDLWAILKIHLILRCLNGKFGELSSSKVMM